MIFREPGTYPGIPGMFANCIVDVDADGTVTVTPLAQRPAIAAVEADEAPPPQDTQETIVSEQAAPTSAPQFIGG